MFDEYIIDFFDDFGKQVDDIRYDDIPIWWFIKMRFLEPDTLPKPFPSHIHVKSMTLDNKMPNRLKSWFTNIMLKWYLEGNEKTKCRLNNNSNVGATKDDKKRIMFLTHSNAIIPDNEYGYTVDRIGSVVNTVREDDELDAYISVIMPLSHRARTLEHGNPFYSYVDDRIKNLAKSNAEILHKKWCMKDINYNSGRLYKIYKPALDFFFSKEMIYLSILYYETYHKIIREEGIKLLCCYSSIGVQTKCAIMAAHRNGIKSLSISHGMSTPSIGLDQPDSVYFAVIGDRYREAFIEVGTKPSNVFVSGPVFMDEIVPYLGHVGDDEDDIPQILIATPSTMRNRDISEGEYAVFIEKLFREINEIDEIDIVIKQHPNENNPNLYKRIAKKIGCVVCVNTSQQKKDLYTLIRDSDLVISCGSTVSVEAMIMQKPSMIINLFDESRDIILDDERVMHIPSDKNITRVVERILYDDDKELVVTQNEIVQEYLYQVDGHANERIVDEIKALIKAEK